MESTEALWWGREGSQAAATSDSVLPRWLGEQSREQRWKKVRGRGEQEEGVVCVEGRGEGGRYL